MAEKKAKIYKVEPPEFTSDIETADQKIAARRVIGPDGCARCGRCGVQLVNVEYRIRCKYCWNCGTPVRWR